MDEAQNCREMPKYKCHKVVHALKIAGLSEQERDGTRYMTPADEGFADIRLDGEFVNKHKPVVGGYLVVYEDGYKSFSPAQAFEEGYTRL
jgi:hypothetical protein